MDEKVFVLLYGLKTFESDNRRSQNTSCNHSAMSSITQLSGLAYLHFRALLNSFWKITKEKDSIACSTGDMRRGISLTWWRLLSLITQMIWPETRQMIVFTGLPCLRRHITISLNGFKPSHHYLFTKNRPKTWLHMLAYENVLHESPCFRMDVILLTNRRELTALFTGDQ